MDRPERHLPEAQVYRPWIGDKYAETGLLVLGLNMNGWGGYACLYEGIPAAKIDLLRKQRVFSGPGYKGSLFHVRMLACAWRALALLGHETPFESVADLWSAAQTPKGPEREWFIEGYSRIAFTNVVKCGPVANPSNPRGAPTPEMIEECPGHVLAGEVELLHPRAVLALGKDVVAAAAALGVGRGWRLFRASHPAARGYALERELAGLA